MLKYKPDSLKVAVGTIYNGKVKEIERLINSFSSDGIDTWFFVGGKFKDSPGSDDDKEAEEVIDNFMNEQSLVDGGINVIRHVMVDCNEFQKRQKYVDMARYHGCNALFVVDTDEYAYENEKWGFERDWEKFRRFFYSYLERYPDHSVYSIKFIWNEFLAHDFHARCWAYPEKITYVQGSHYKFGNPEQDDVLDALFTHQPTWGVIEGIALKHDHSLRSDEDMKNRRGYQDYLVKYEQFLERTDLTEGDPAQARIMALREVAPFQDGCVCMKCFKMKKMEARQVYDPRPRDKRELNPYVTGIPL